MEILPKDLNAIKLINTKINTNITCPIIATKIIEPTINKIRYTLFDILNLAAKKENTIRKAATNNSEEPRK